MTRKFINIKGSLLDLTIPKVMGIINATPDSFYEGSRVSTLDEIRKKLDKMVEEGVDILDVGGYSSRPGAEGPDQDMEIQRVSKALKLIRKRYPDLPLSVDTFRSEVARIGIEYYGADIVNDVSGGEFDKKMYGLVASKGVAYILMHMKGRPETMQDKPRYNDVMDEITYWLSVRVKRLIKEGLKDIIIDPGFGFGKTLEHNYTILKNLDRFQVLGLPVLAGLSRKSMIWKKLSISPSEALNGTSILNTIALQKGASILRVHDVKEAKELICLFNAVNTES